MLTHSIQRWAAHLPRPCPSVGVCEIMLIFKYLLIIAQDALYYSTFEPETFKDLCHITGMCGCVRRALRSQRPFRKN